MTEHNKVAVYTQQPIDISEIPTLVSKHTQKIAELKAKVDDAIAKAKKSEEEAKNLKEKYHWYNSKTNAINDLQNVVKSILESQSSLAEAQQKQFEYQEMLGKITQALFMLGMLNMAANRSVVQQLRQELEGAEPGKLDELAKNEIQRTIGQLQAQQDILQKQDDFAHSLAESNEALNLYAQAAVKINDDNENLKMELDNLRISIRKKDNSGVVIKYCALGLSILAVILGIINLLI